MNYPFVSLIIPCRNEVNYISKSLGSVLETDYPKERLEVIVVDGESDDGTQAILQEIASRNPVVKILSNPKKIIPSALNIGIKNSIGEIIIRVDAHSEYPPDYINRCVQRLNHTDAWCVGGPFYTTPAENTLMAKIIASILSCPFGVGPSYFRVKKKPAYVDVVPFGVFRKDIFDKVGLYDERLLRTEDNEMCDRITKHGGKIFMDPDIKNIYYARASLKAFLKNARSNGMWIAFTNRLLPYTFKWRHSVPLVFFIGIFLCLTFVMLGALGYKMFIFLGAFPIFLYFFLAILFSYRICNQNKLSFLSIPLITFVFLVHHINYGYGALRGWVLVLTGLWQRGLWKRSAIDIPIDSLPFVTIIMPIRNEAGFIKRCLSSVLAQDYPSDRMEVIVADGMSTDGTRKILSELQVRYPQLLVIDNPEKNASTGLNAGLEIAKGEIIIRVDGHSLVTRNFVKENVTVLAEQSEAWSVGGPIVHTADTLFGKAAAVAMSHAFGVGDAFHRFANYEGYVESAQFPAVRRWVFERVGKFDEQLVRNQDDEFNYRIRKAGGTVYISPRIRYSYYVREHIRQLFRQYYQYGFWRIKVISKHQRLIALRYPMPALFYLAIFGLLLWGLLLKQMMAAFTLPVLYVAALVIAGLSTWPKAGFKIASLVPLATATIHIGYALGFIYGLWASIFNPNAWDNNLKMTVISR